MPLGEANDIKPFRVRSLAHPQSAAERMPHSGLDDPSSQEQDCREFGPGQFQAPTEVHGENPRAACGRRCRVNRLIIR